MVISGRDADQYAEQKKVAQQKTIRKSGSLEGVGVHSGQGVSVTFKPAPVNTGIVFERTDCDASAQIQALWHQVSDTRMSTQLRNADGVTIAMVEHLMAALAGLEIDNLYVQVSGPEMPVLDGSSHIYADAVGALGLVTQEANRLRYKILKPVEVRQGDKYVRLEPAAKTTYDFSFDFFGGRDGVAAQTMSFDWTPAGFLREISKARTFGFFEDGQKLQAMGLAKGASLENTLVLHEGKVMNAGGERLRNECVRHKILDAVGDMALAGAPIVGAYTSHNGGHEMNNHLLRMLFADATAWREEVIPQEVWQTWQPFASIAI